MIINSVASTTVVLRRGCEKRRGGGGGMSAVTSSYLPSPPVLSSQSLAWWSSNLREPLQTCPSSQIQDLSPLGVTVPCIDLQICVQSPLLCAARNLA